MSPERYAASIGAFDWGVFDCISFAHGWYVEVTGKTHPLFPTKPYESEIEAARALRAVFREAGVSSVPDLFDTLFDRCDPTDGALCVIETGRVGIVSTHQTGVCNSKWTMLTVGKKGPVMMPTDNAICWEIK